MRDPEAEADYLARKAAQDRTLETARAGLRRRTVGLGDQRDYYERMAADTSLPKKERTQWQALADELTARLGDRRDAPEEQAGLF
jgi:hypothetical protein